jgi:hypothetical protein
MCGRVRFLWHSTSDNEENEALSTEWETLARPDGGNGLLSNVQTLVPGPRAIGGRAQALGMRNDVIVRHVAIGHKTPKYKVKPQPASVQSQQRDLTAGIPGGHGARRSGLWTRESAWASS